MIMAVKDAHLKLVDVVAFANVDIEENVTNQLVTAGSFVTASQVRQQLEQHPSMFTYSLLSFSDPSPIIAWPCQ